MCISFLVPMPAYSQGLHPDMAVTSFADEWNPELAGLGFTSVPRWRYSMLPKSFISSSPFVSGDKDPVAIDPNMEVVGDTVAFDWLKTDYPRLHGEFATGGYFEYWTLDRRFTDYWENLTSMGVVDNISAGEYLQHVHVASRKRRSMPGEDGDADNYVNGFKGLKAIGYNKYVSFECGCQSEDRAATVINALNLLRKQWEEA